MNEGFTPEQQEAYDKEMQRLEAGSTKDTKVEATPSPEKKQEEAKPEESAEELRERLKLLEKRVSDAQTWGHRNAAEVKRLKEEAENRKREQSRPAILDANPGLEDAITHVAGPKQNDEQKWLESVGTVIPDLETLLGDPSFEQKAKARRDQVGQDWSNPLIAARELSDLKVSHLRDKAVTAASEAARKDFEAKSKKRTAMEVPGGSGGRDSVKSTEDAEAQRFRNMTPKEIEAERRKVLGY